MVTKSLGSLARRLTAPPDSLAPAQAQPARALLAVAWLLIVLVPAGVLLSIWLSPESAAWLAVVAAIVLAIWAAILGLVKRGHVSVASHAMVLGLWLVATLQAWLGGGLYTAAYAGYLPLVVLAGTFLGGRAMAGVAAASILAGAAMLTLDALGWMPAARYEATAAIYWIVVSIYTIVMAGVIFYNKWVARQALAEAQAELAERARAEQSLSESERRFAALFEYGPVPNSLVRLSDNHILDVNLAWQELWGIARTEAVGKTALELGLWLNPDDRVSMMERLHARRQVTDFAAVLRSQARGERHILLSVRLLTVNGDECMILQLVDVTERRELESRLREANERFDQIASNVPEVFWMYDIRLRRPVYVSPAFERIWGWSDPGLERFAQRFAESIFPEDRTAVRATLERRDQGQPTEAEYRIVRPDGAVRWVSERSVPVCDDSGSLLQTVGIITDVTERRHADALQGAIYRIVMAAQTAESLAALYPAVHREVAQVMTADSFYIALYDEGSDLVEIPYWVDKIDAEPAPFHPAGTLTGYVLRTQRPLLYRGDVAEVDAALVGTMPKVWLGAPLMVDGRVFGVIATWDYTDAGAYTERDRLVWEFVSSQVAASISRKQAEIALRESEEKYRSLLASLDNMIASIDRAGRILYLNDTAARFLGDAPAASVIGRTMHDVFPAPVAERQMDVVRHVIREAQPLLVPEMLSTVVSGDRWFRVSAMPVHDHTGQVVYALINGTDIHDLKMGEVALRRQLDIQQVVATIAQQFVGLDGQNRNRVIREMLARLGTQCEVDRCYLVLFDEARDEVTYGHEWCADGIAPSLAFGQRIAVAARSPLSPPLLQGEVVNVARVADLPADTPELAYISADGILSFLLLPLTSKAGTLGIIGFSNVRTERLWQEWEINLLTIVGRIVADGLEHLQREQEVVELNQSLENRVQERTEELRQSRDELSAANVALQNASRTKDEFLANMSHELRTPLNGVLTSTEMLLMEIRGPLNEHQRRLLEIAETSGRHLLSLINDVLDLAKVGAGRLEVNPEPVVIEDLCQACLVFVKGPAGKNSVTLHFLPDPLAVTMQADPRRLKQMLVNLLSNAVKFTPAHGEVTLQVRADEDARQIEFAVSDTGIGIAPEDVQHLFKPFTQVDGSLTRRYEGTGLGLALVKELATLHGGDVYVTSEVGKGSCFTICLPWHGASELPTSTAVEAGDGAEQTPHAGSAISRGTVLLVEDHEVNRLVMGEYLASIGYTVIYAEDGEVALELAEQSGPDIILMDIQLPGMSGFDAIAQLRAHPCFAATPIFALTALAMAGDRERCLAAGATGYVSKPVALSDLARLMQEHLVQD
ncbi:MAG: PAS domain S-box protein [Caldilineaceae bacterium]|nr:PAS domain S-box protein [Caldilineaceae bacterium]